MSKISCEEAKQALQTLDQNPEAYWTLEEFIRQVDDLMKIRNMTIPMLLRARQQIGGQ
jgi:hypothetical protein